MSKKKTDQAKETKAKPAQPAPSAPAESPQPTPPVVDETSTEPKIVEAPQDQTNIDPLSQENNPPAADDNTGVPLMPIPAEDPEAQVQQTPVLPEDAHIIEAPAADPNPSKEEAADDEDENEDEEQEGDLRIIDDSRIPDEIYAGQSFFLGLNQKLDVGTVITKKLKTGEHSFRIQNNPTELEGDKGKYFNYLVSHAYDTEEPLEKPIKKSFIRGKFEVVEK